MAKTEQIESIERHVVLVGPEVHWNTGNIGRTCLGVGACLHLIEPLGFSLEEKEVRRAGLDYWHKVRLRVWKDFQTFVSDAAPRPSELILFTKNGEKSFWDMPAMKRMFLVFGSETRGLPDELLHQYPNSQYHIPSTREIRCLNLSTAVGIALYESLRKTRPSHAWLA